MGFQAPPTRKERQAFLRLYDKEAMRYKSKLSKNLIRMLEDICEEFMGITRNQLENIDIVIDYVVNEIAIQPGTSYYIMTDNCITAAPFDRLPTGVYRFVDRRVIDGEGKYPWLILRLDPNSVGAALSSKNRSLAIAEYEGRRA